MVKCLGKSILVGKKKIVQNLIEAQWNGKVAYLGILNKHHPYFFSLKKGKFSMILTSSNEGCTHYSE